MGRLVDKETLREGILACGFDLCGFTRPALAAADAERMEAWVEKGYGARMGWLNEQIRQRARPQQTFEWAATAICLGLSYARPEPRDQGVLPAISRYAQGRSYHNVIRKRMRRTYRLLEDFGSERVRGYCDTGPVAERPLARQAGLGWIGKHSLLLNRDWGSYLFLAVVFCDLPVTPDGVATDHCGNCNACVDACPTDAIISDGVVDARRCISYLNIEHRETFEAPYDASLHGMLHGCDICQEVCPFVQASQLRGRQGDPDFAPREHWRQTSLLSLTTINNEQWDALTRGSDVRRGGQERLRRIAQRLVDNP